MKEFHIFFTFLILPFLAVLAGYFIGRYVERLQWNNLIADGVIPAPPKRRKLDR